MARAARGETPGFGPTPPFHPAPGLAAHGAAAAAAMLRPLALRPQAMDRGHRGTTARFRGPGGCDAQRGTVARSPLDPPAAGCLAGVHAERDGSPGGLARRLGSCGEKQPSAAVVAGPCGIHQGCLDSGWQGIAAADGNPDPAGTARPSSRRTGSAQPDRRTIVLGRPLRRTHRTGHPPAARHPALPER